MATMRRRSAYGQRGPKRPTLWIASADSFTLGGANPDVSHGICSAAFGGFVGALGDPVMQDVVLQKSNLDFSVLSGAVGEVQGAYGLQIATLDTDGTVPTTLPTPFTNAATEWILHGFVLGAAASTAAWVFGAQAGGGGTRVESKAKRRLRDTDVLVLSWEFVDTGITIDVSFGMRNLLRGR